jgi:NifB/MoaA-like Fe-S oxidoreductase
LTVTGLLTGTDLYHFLSDRDLGDGLLVPKLMLKHGTTQFLDDMTIEEVAEKLNCRLFLVGGGPEDLMQTCLQNL